MYQHAAACTGARSGSGQRAAATGYQQETVRQPQPLAAALAVVVAQLRRHRRLLPVRGLAARSGSKLPVVACAKTGPGTPARRVRWQRQPKPQSTKRAARAQADKAAVVRELRCATRGLTHKAVRMQRCIRAIGRQPPLEQTSQTIRRGTAWPLHRPCSLSSRASRCASLRLRRCPLTPPPDPSVEPTTVASFGARRVTKSPPPSPPASSAPASPSRFPRSRCVVARARAGRGEVWCSRAVSPHDMRSIGGSIPRTTACGAAGGGGGPAGGGAAASNPPLVMLAVGIRTVC